jgi:small-conductance mechanosensitive channel
VIGDFIIVDDYPGTVEKIGLKTTRICSLSGEQLGFSNHDLLQSCIHNDKHMGERRVVFSFGVTVQTSPGQLEKTQVMIRAIVESQSPIRFDRAHFKSFGDSALIFEVVYYVLSPDFAIYMDIQQSINPTLMRLFQQNGIEFAHPTQTLYLAKDEVKP